MPANSTSQIDLGNFAMFVFCGFALGFVAQIPACVVVEMTTGSPRRGEAVGTLVFWICIALGFGFAFLDHSITERRKRKEKAWEDRGREKVEQMRRLREKERYREAQRGIRSSIDSKRRESLVLYEALPTYLQSAEKHLDQADLDFEEGAFSPFWNSIEKAARNLAAFDDSVRRISKNISGHEQLAERLDGRVPTFPISISSVDELAAASAVSNRMNSIIRTAQRDFQFSLIYEQRKTSRILASGFETLGEVLDGIGAQLIDSINQLGNSVSEASSSVVRSVEKVDKRVERAAEEIAERVSSMDSSQEANRNEMTARHDEALQHLAAIRNRIER